MSVTTETFNPDGLLAGDFPVISEGATLLSGESVVRGALLGKVTASGKLVLSLSASADGSETPYAIAAATVDASAADAAIPVYLSGEFDSSKVTFGTGHTAASVKDGLRAVGIYLKTNTLDAV